MKGQFQRSGGILWYRASSNDLQKLFPLREKTVPLGPLGLQSIALAWGQLAPGFVSKVTACVMRAKTQCGANPSPPSAHYMPSVAH